MTLARNTLLFHVAAVAMAAFSLLVLIPHPELWRHLPGSGVAFGWAMDRAGPLHIVAGAAAMLAVGTATVGPRVTWTWFGVAATLSLGMELLGTGTGWPFGNYSYTLGLGGKILDRVPWSIPLSWYYLTFSSFLLARTILAERAPNAPFAATALLTTWLLTAWDLVLDPAMAHPDRHLAFWQWHERGAYLGMPLANLLGWMATGVAITAVGRWFTGDAPFERIPAWFPYVMYVTNLGFGVILCAGVGLWAPIALAFLAGIAPATLAILPARAAPPASP